ncbi:MAG: UDP-N-acetylglucosamine 2-epimerase (non-hydrolyzing) [Gammaproteobacteria bacterium]|nr:UDP-N-acetylglucosamine 2-epimerase (non-hydrolyzing) [Gammaproteobacteria bacterium]
MKKITVHLIAAARPNFMKVAPLYHAMVAAPWCEPIIVHTGQHYDANMSDAFFNDLQLPKPTVHLGVGSGSHAEQTGGVMIAYEKVCMADRPDWIVVCGDVNSTIACALVGAKLWIPVIHLEAGLRSGDRAMPEEINRLATDSIAEVLWTPSPDGDEHLLREGVTPERITRIGNIMIDSFELMRNQIEADGTRHDMGLKSGKYGVVTLHRPSNVDTREALQVLVDQLVGASRQIRLVFAVHPRTRARLQEFELEAQLGAADGMILCDPLGYIQFMNLVTGAAMVITDSGGIQEETTYLGIPCMTLRTSTERPITVTQGTNRLIKPAQLLVSINKVVQGDWPTGRRPDLWDGRTAQRAVEDLYTRLNN